VKEGVVAETGQGQPVQNPADVVPETIDPWMASQVDRRLSRQEASRNTLLLLVTFAEGIAATLVASGLQVGKHHGLLVAASMMLGLGFIAIVVLLLLDRSVQVDERQVIGDAYVRGLSADHLRDELQQFDLTAIEINDGVLSSMRNATFVQMAIAAAAATLAVVAMLIPTQISKPIPEPTPTQLATPTPEPPPTPTATPT
jgi:hypothetical protein